MLVDTLNRKQETYNKQYIAAIIILMSVSNLPICSDIVSKLKPLFYQNLPVLLSQVAYLSHTQDPN